MGWSSMGVNHHELQQTIQWSFRKCDITVAIDGSEDHDINIRGLVNYQVQLPVTTSDMDPLDPILIATRMSPLLLLSLVS